MHYQKVSLIKSYTVLSLFHITCECVQLFGGVGMFGVYTNRVRATRTSSTDIYIVSNDEYSAKLWEECLIKFSNAIR